jgi:hypothetical protein
MGQLQQPPFQNANLTFTSWRVLQHPDQPLRVVFSTEITERDTVVLQLRDWKSQKRESAAGLEVHAYELVPWRGMNDDRARSRTEDSGI